MSKLHMKSILAVLLVAVAVAAVPMAQATVTVEVTAAGSSAQWQSMALAAYASLSSTITKGHWTSNGNVVNLVDSRTNPQNIDAGTLWVVWSCTTTACTSASVWMFDKVDSVVGDRCFFAVPKCTLSATAANLAGSGSNKIKNFLWSDASSDTALPAVLLTLIEGGTPIGVAASDIRAEDGMFAMCRANSALGGGTYGTGGTNDNLDGLGYNTHNASGVCPAGPLGSSSNQAVGSPVLSGLPGAASTDQANIVAFNVVAGGADPITGSTVPAYSVVNVGAAPIVIVTARQQATGLQSVSNVTPAQLQQVFSGTNCDATAFGVTSGTGLNIFLREPTSGTMNTTEATLFRGPLNGSGTALGLSQETGVNGGTNNPLKGQSGTCTSASGTGARYRGIGTGEVITGVQESNCTSGCSGITGTFNTPQDGIAYAFFSYGNVSAIADSTKYGYVTVNGIDPIFSTYNGGSGAGYDPGQPASGELPGAADLKLIGNPTYCNATNGFPCEENQIWKGGLSFPNVRNGSYPSWSLLRAYAATTGGQLAALNTLVANGQKNAVNSVPDYIPFKAYNCTTTATTFPCPDGAVSDPGLLVERAHYLQYDGAGTAINTGTVQNFSKTGSFVEAGGDMGGEVFTCPTATTCPNSASVVVNASTHVYTPQSQQVVLGFNNGGFSVRH